MDNYFFEFNMNNSIHTINIYKCELFSFLKFKNYFIFCNLNTNLIEIIFSF